MNKSISNKIKYLYLVLTLGMVMYHARWINLDNVRYINNIDRISLDYYSNFANHIGTVCMTFFFFMSSFWFYKDLNTKDDLIKKWKKRIKTLLIPFIIWSFILLIYKIMFSGLQFKWDHLFYYFFEKPVAGPLWYLLALLILQLFSPLLLHLKKYKKITITLLCLISAYVVLRRVGYIPTLLTFSRWWWYENLISYIPIYLLGSYLGMYYSNLVVEKEYESRKYTIIGVILLILSFILWNFFNLTSYILILYSLIELIGIWLILKPSFCKKEIPKYIDCAFYVYALHNPVLIPVTNKLYQSIINNYSISGLRIISIKIIQIITILVICVVIKYILLNYLPSKLNKYLTGER